MWFTSFIVALAKEEISYEVMRDFLRVFARFANISLCKYRELILKLFKND